MARKRTAPRKVLAITPIAAQDERDKFNGVCRYIAAHRKNWELQILRSDLTPSHLASRLDMDIDGVIFDCTTDNPDALAVLAACKHPLVVFASSDLEPFDSRPAPTAFIASDEAAIGNRAADYLVEQGSYTAFAYIGYARKRKWSALRGSVFAARLAQRQFATSTLAIDPWSREPECEKRKLQDFLQALPRPAAVFVANDELAYWVTTVAVHNGIVFSKDLVLLGVDNDEILCKNARPTISSIQPEFEKAGFLAAETLDRMMSGLPCKRERRFGISEVIRRDSTIPRNPHGQLVRRIDEIIDREFSTLKSVNDIAARLNASRRLIDLRYRQVKGLSILEAIQNRRLERVRLLLRESTLGFAEIAETCGFSSETYLMRLFKSRYGLTLRSYRLG